MNKTIHTLFVILLCCTFSTIGIAQSLEDKFQEVLDTTYQSNLDAVGILFHVESPDKNISWTSAVGFRIRIPNKK